MTPEVLQQRFGLPAELGTVPVPRVVEAFEGLHPGDRKAFLGSFYPAVMSGAIAFEGQHGRTVKGHRKGVTQATMAEHAGVRRETITARISKLASPAKARTARSRWLQARATRDTNLAKLELHKLGCEECAAGTPCKSGAALERRANCTVGDERDYEPQPRRALAAIFQRRRRFAMASRYDLRMTPRREMIAVFDSSTGYECKRFFDREKAVAAAERMTRASFERGSCTAYEVGTVEIDPKRYSYPSIEQLVAGDMAAWFDANFKAKGFKAQSRWVWDARLRDPDTGRTLGTLPRLVMSLYESRGLLDEVRNEDGKVTSPKGILVMHQKKAARLLGCSVPALHAANQKWQALGVLRIVSGEPKLTESGYRRGPMKVVYLPFRMLTEAEAEIEEKRMAEACRRVLARQGAQRFAQVLDAQHIHRDLLAEWRGREHCLGAFWRECGRRLEAALIFPDLIADLIPPFRPKELDPDWFDTRS
jgi:hypothetical protein